MNFVDYFLEYTKDVESPTSFLKWSALSILSAVLRDNFFLDHEKLQVYPNIFVILMAKSGACRKSTPLKISAALLKQVQNTKIIEGRTSIQAAMRKLSQAETSENGHMIKGASAFFYSEELRNLVVEDPQAIGLLTDLYDYHEKYSVDLISGGTSVLNHVCISLLAASNEVFFREIYTNSAIYGGLLGRTFIVAESKRRHKNSMMYLSAGHPPAPLVLHLKALSVMGAKPDHNPKLEMEAEAKEYYHEWYNTIEDSWYERDLIGFDTRMHTHVLKVAILLAAAREDFQKSIKKQDVESAIDLVVPLRSNYTMLMMGAAKNDIQKASAKFLAMLYEAPEHILTHKHIMGRLWGEIDHTQMATVVATMEQAGFIRTTQHKGDIAYQLTQTALEQFRT